MKRPFNGWDQEFKEPKYEYFLQYVDAIVFPFFDDSIIMVSCIQI